MSDRVIAIQETVESHPEEYSVRYDRLRPDPEAPSVAEIVKVLKCVDEAFDSLSGNGITFSHGSPGKYAEDRLDDLIARLEGA